MTLQDIVKLSNLAEKDSIKAEQYQEALKGGYLLTEEQAKNNIVRKQTGEHLPDSGVDGDTGLGLPSGKLPWHPTFSEESPYANGLASASAGKWSKSPEGWIYTPSKGQFDRNLNYERSLAEYFAENAGNGEHQTYGIQVPGKGLVTDPKLMKGGR